MRALAVLVVPAVLFVLAGACGPRSDDDRAADAQATDAGGGDEPDAGRDGELDGGSGLPLPGFGAISGDCDVLDDELTSPAPSRFGSRFAFTTGYTEDDLGALTAGGQELVAAGNAGGSSLLSEVFAFELLARCEGAVLLKTETEITYAQAGPITDLLVELDGEKLGVSVTRAVAFPFGSPYPVAQATSLLDRKLDDIVASSASVAAADRWTKQLLVVLAYDDAHAASLATALDDLDAATLSDTIVWVIVSDGDDGFVYCNGPCD